MRSIYDGLGNAPFVTDVADRRGQVALIGDLSEREALERVPCDGLALSPGFIDVHSHSDELWLADPRCLSKITQGVTTEIGGNCGTSVAPLARRGAAAQAARRAQVPGSTSTGKRSTSSSRSSTATASRSTSPRWSGLGTTRACISGPSDRRLGHGGTGRAGAPRSRSGRARCAGRFERTDLRTVSLCRSAGAHRLLDRRPPGRGRRATFHTSRDEGDGRHRGRRRSARRRCGADVAVQCSHHKAAGRRNWGKVHRTLDLHRTRPPRRSARSASMLTRMSRAGPSWRPFLPDPIRRGGEAATLERLRDAGNRRDRRVGAQSSAGSGAGRRHLARHPHHRRRNRTQRRRRPVTASTSSRATGACRPRSARSGCSSRKNSTCNARSSA